MRYYIILFTSIFFLSSCSGLEKESIVTTEPKTEKTILALGDSLTAGYGVELEDSYPSQLEKMLLNNGYNYKVINAGVSGDTSSQLLERIDLYLETTPLPEVVILVIGGNDGLRGMSLENLEQNIRAIIEKCKKKNIKIILGGMITPSNMGIKYMNDFASLYDRIADDEDIIYMDSFLKGVATKSHLNIEDGIHPNKEGYSIIVEKLYDILLDKNLVKKG